MKSKQKIKTIASTLAVATAISTATTLPVDLVQQVQALDEGNGITLAQNSIEPTKKAELKAELDKINKESADAVTALEQAKVNRIDALVAYNEAKDSYTEQEHAYGVAHDDINGTIQQARIDRGLEYDKIENDLESQKETVEYWKKLVADKENELSTAQANYDTMKKAIENGEIPDNKDNQNKLRELERNVDKLTSDLEDLKTHQGYAEEWIGTYTRQLAAAQQKIDNRNKAEEEWEEIHNNTRTEFSYFENDDLLNGLNAKLPKFYEEREKLQTATDTLDKAKQKYDEADKIYQDAADTYDEIDEKLEAAEKAYNDYISTYGDISASTITIDANVLYTGKEVSPNIVIRDSLGNIIDPSEYTVIYSNNIELGVATVTIIMNGENYIGTFTKEFNIVKELPKEDQKPSNPENNGNTGNIGNTTLSNTNTTNTSNTKESKSSKRVKTGDETPIIGFGLITMLSSALFFFTKNKKEEQ